MVGLRGCLEREMKSVERNNRRPATTIKGRVAYKVDNCRVLSRADYWLQQVRNKDAFVWLEEIGECEGKEGRGAL